MEGLWSGRLARYRRSVAIFGGVAAATALVLTVATVVQADDEDREHGKAIDTRADYTPFERFEPVPASSPCVGAGTGLEADPFVIPPGYEQQVVAEETDPVRPDGSSSEDLWDMNTQNEFGEDAGRYVYRTHEVGAAPNSGDPPRNAGGAAVTVTDLKTGQTRTLAERNDWERFDGIVWTPWGTILAAEEVIVASARDPQVPQAQAGLVYELFVDKDEPWKLDPSRERITPGDGTTDSVRDGIRARPALGSKSHEGMRFDKRGYHYGIAETRGETEPGRTGGTFRFIPDRKGDLSKGTLYVFRADGETFAPGYPSYGPGRWIPLDREAVQVDADAEAERKGASQYQRAEDVETGESTGKDVNNGGQTLYVDLTEGVEEGVMAIDLRRKDRPVAYPYVGKAAGNASEPEFDSPDNLALDRKGNLAISEDPPGNPVGADIWIAEPPRDDDEGGRHEPARTVQRFASLKDCAAEPTGIYFALKGTEKWADGQEYDLTVGDESLFVNRQHSGQGTTSDQFVSIAPVDDDDDRDNDDN